MLRFNNRTHLEKDGHRQTGGSSPIVETITSWHLLNLNGGLSCKFSTYHLLFGVEACLESQQPYWSAQNIVSSSISITFISSSEERNKNPVNRTHHAQPQALPTVRGRASVYLCFFIVIYSHSGKDSHRHSRECHSACVLVTSALQIYTDVLIQTN
jgi:hypothetical protein